MYTYIYIYIYINIYTYIHIHTYIYVYMYVHMYTCVICVFVHTYINMYICHIYTLIHMYIYTDISLYTNVFLKFFFMIFSFGTCPRFACDVNVFTLTSKNVTKTSSWKILARVPLAPNQVPRLCCSVLQCVAVCCSVLQCVAVCCSARATCIQPDT